MSNKMEDILKLARIEIGLMVLFSFYKKPHIYDEPLMADSKPD